MKTWQLLDDFFHFFWIDVISLRFDQVLETSVEVENPVLVVMSQIARTAESVFSPEIISSQNFNMPH